MNLEEAKEEIVRLNDEVRRWREGAKHAEEQRRQAKAELAFFYSALEEEGNYWAWMDCGDNAIESLCCAVVMDPEHLREIFKLIEDARNRFNDYERDFNTESTPEHREFMLRLSVMLKKAE